MKLHLPTKLYRAVLACCAAAFFTTLANAEVPEGYTPVTITDAEQLSAYKNKEYMAFIIGADITDTAYHMTGNNQYWTSSSAEYLSSVTFNHVHVSGEIGDAAIHGEVLTMENLKDITFLQNSSDRAIVVANEISHSALVRIANNGRVNFEKNSGISVAYHDNDGGAVCGIKILFENNDELTFLENYTSCSSSNSIVIETNGGAIYGSNIDFLNNGRVAFQGNYSRTNWGAPSRGGAIYTLKTLSLADNDIVEFSGNNTYAADSSQSYASAEGGAIYGSTIELLNNDSVLFSGNYTYGTVYGDGINYSSVSHGSVTVYGFSYGGAIYDETGLTLSANKHVEFSGNHTIASRPPSSTTTYYYAYSYARGGAIYTLNTFSLTGNGSVEFKGNYSSASDLTNGSSYGGAIDSYNGPISIVDNESVSFSENYCYTSNAASNGAYGGAVSTEFSTAAISFTGNGSVTFRGNYCSASNSGSSTSTPTSRGGAIYAAGSLSLTGNDQVTFNGNYCSSMGGEVNDSLGGAICAYYGSTSIAENESVTFSGNYCLVTNRNGNYAKGGAIYTIFATLSLTGNDSVEFRSNYEKMGSGSTATYRLRSVYMEGNSTLKLAAGEGQSITFYDTLYSDARTLTISFNADYEDKDGVTQKGAGDILFSGKYAKVDLKALKASYTQQEVTNSITSQIYAMTHLYGGRLRIEDGAIYMGYGITAEVDSAATVRLQGGTLSHNGYKLTFNAGTTLEAQGVNRITASSLDLLDGSALTFTLGEANLTTAAVTLTGTFNQGGALTINLADDGTMALGSKYALLTMSSSATPTTWDASKVTVEGLDADISDLSWSNGTLYLTAPLPELTTATWSGAASMVWNTTAKNWTQDGYKYAYKDGVDVLFGNTGAGTVTLSGTLAPKSVLADSSGDYTWSGSGKLTGDMTLTKSGTGSLTISTANTYTGGTVLNEGILVAGSNTAFGTGTLQVNGGVLDLDGYALSNSLTAENADVVIKDGTLQGTFNINGGNVDATGLRIDSQDVEVTRAGDVVFRDSAATDNGGAICVGVDSIVSFTGNDTVTFSGNSVTGDSISGGAIYAVGTNSSVSFTENETVTFSGNYATGTDAGIDTIGGAIFVDGGSIDLTGNGSVEFSMNSSYFGGAISVRGGSINLEGNESVTFSGNSAKFGGAIVGDRNSNSSITLSGNGSVVFSDNSTTSLAGAILGATITLSGNGSVVFSDNSATSHAGAILGDTITLSGNDSVTFRGNCYEKSGSGHLATYRLLSIAMNDGSTLNLSAGAGQNITFYDTLFVSNNSFMPFVSLVSYNARYQDKDGVMQDATGDIVFSGKYAAEDLMALKPDYTQQELTDSLTSEVYDMTHLYGGRLRIEDGAIYKGNGITAEVDSASTVRLQGGTLDHAGYALTFNAGTTLEAQGVNSITASSLDMLDGSALTFTLGEANLTTAAVTLTGTFNQGGALTINLADDGTMAQGNEYALLTMTAGTTPESWDPTKVTVNGLDASLNSLKWQDGTLYLGYAPELVTATWCGSESMVWDTTAKNWTQDGYKFAYKDGVDVIFGNTGAGTVTLAGTLAPKSVLVDSSSDYTWSGDGSLTGNMVLTKSGTGSLTISTANTYTGGTAINGGKVVAMHATALGAGVVTLSNGTLEIAANGFANGISASGTSALRVEDGYTLALSQMLANSGILTVSGTVNASALTLDTTAATHIDVNGQSGASGFAKSAYYSVQVVNGGTVGGEDAVITHINLPGTETLHLGTDGYATAGGVVDYSNYLLTGSDTATTSAIHGKGAGATVTQQGGTLTVDDTVMVTTTAGSINLAGGTLDGIITNATINAASGALNAALTGSNTLNGTEYTLQTVVNNGGTLTMSGSFDASALHLDTTEATHIDVNGHSGASGFAKDAIYSVTVANGTTVNGGATITHGTHNLVLGADGVAKVGGDIDYSNYLLTGSDTATTSAIHALGAGATVTQQGGTLTVDDAVTVTTTAGAINLAGGMLDGIVTNATINAASGALNAALTGSNTLNGTGYALQTAVNNAGTLTMSGSFDASALHLDTTAATHIDVDGQSGASGFAKDAIYSVTVANGTTVNGGATITHGTHNLVLGTDGVAKVGGDIDYSNYLLTGSDTASTAAIHAQGAGATVTQQGGTLTVDDTVTVTTTAGVIDLAGGTLDGIVTNATINAASGALNAALTGSNTLAGTNYALQSVVNNGGTLTMSGSFDASALHLDTTEATHIDVNGQSGASGFAKDAIYSVTVANGTTVNGGATITHGTHNLVLGADGVAKVGGDIDYSNYLLTGSDTASTAAIHAQGVGATVTQQGGTLTVDDAVMVTTTAGAINLAGGTLDGIVTNATINAASGALNAALSGSNTLNGAGYALQSVVNNAGTLTMSGSFDASALHLDTTAATHIDVNGHSGASGFAKDAIYSVTVANGTTVNGGATITHGTHNLVLGADGVAKVGGDIDYSNYLLTGSDTANTAAIHAQGAGATVTQQGGTLTVDDTVTVTTTAGAITLAGGTVGGSISNVAITATGGVIDATVSGGASLSVAGGAVTVNGANSYTGGTEITGGTVTLGNGGTLGTGDIDLVGGTLDTGDGLTLAGGQTLALNGGGIRGDLATTAGATIDLNTATSIEGDLTLSGGSILYSGASLDATGTVTITAATTLDVSGYKTEGTYKLLGYGSLSGDLGQLILPVDTQQATRINYSLHDQGTELQLTIDGNALELTWKGGSGEWKTLGEQQWQLPGSVTAADPRFHADDRVKFTQGGTVSITGEVKPGSVLVGGTEAVVFQGTGSIIGAASLTKEGASELTLNAANAYTGGTTVKSGTVHAGGVQSFGSGEIVLQGGTLDLGAHAVENAVQASGGTLQASAYAGTVTVGGDMQVGSGTKLAHLVVNSGSVTAGSLVDTEIIAHGGNIGTNATGASSVTADGDVTLSGTNTYTGKTEVRGGTLHLTGSVTSDIDVKGGALAVDSLALNNQVLSLNGGDVTGSVEVTSGSRLAIDSAASISGTLTLNGGTLALSGKDLTIGGNLVLASASVLDLSGYGTAGVYTLASYSGLVGDLSLLSIPLDVQQSSRLNYSLDNTGTALTLTVDGNALTLTWKGGDGTWKTLGEQEWQLPASVTTADPRFHADDSVVFANGGTVTIEGDVKPGSVLVGGTEAVVFQGTGSIIGAGSLTKEGSGSLAMNATNSYSGGTTVKAGTLTAGGAQSFGSGDITLEGGTLNLGGHAVLNDIKAHGGTLNGTAYNGVLTVEGNLTVGDNTTAKSLELASGSISGGSLSNVIVTAHAGSISSAITGGGSVTVDGDVTLSGDSSYTGRTTVTAGTLTAGHGNAFGAGIVSLENATLDLAGYAVGNSIQTVGGTLMNAQAYLGALTVNGDLALTGATQASAVTLNNGSISGGSISNALVTAHAGSISSDITGVGSVTVDGNVTLSGANSYNGKTTITAGTLTAGSDSALGAGNVSLEGGTLDLAGHAIANNMTATGGTLAGATAYTGTLTVNGELQLGAGTTAGAIVLNTDGSLNGGSVTGTTITANGGVIATQLTGANSIIGVGYVMDRVLDNAGTLTMSGSFDASALHLDTTAATHIDVNGQSGASGFAKDAIYSVTVANGTTVNEGATITHGTHNLVLGTDGVAKVGGDIDYSNYLLTGSDIASTAAIHAQGAGATVTQQGGTLTVDDAVTVTTTAGAINLAGGTLDGIVTNATINAASGALNAALTGSNTLNGTGYALQSAVNNGGTLTMSGSFDASALHLDTTEATHIDVDGQSGASGFAKDAIYSVTVAKGATVNEGATITHGTHNLVLGNDGVAKVGGEIDYSNYLLTGSDTASTAAIHAQGAGATVTQTGGTLTVDDTVTVTTTAGAINLAGGTLDGIVTNATINAASGALNAALTGSNTLNGAGYALQSVVNNAGTLTMSGSFDASALHLDTTAATHIDVNGQSGASGFAKDAIYSVTVANGTIVNGGATITHGTHNLVLGADGVAKAGGDIDYSNYLLTGSDTASTAAIHAQGAGATVTQQGGTLTVDDAVTVTTTAGAINLAGGTLDGTVSGATINAASGALNAALSGSNTLNGTSYALQSVVNNGGTLTMSGSFDASALHLDTTEATHIDVNGQSGASGFAKDAIYSVTVANGTTVNGGATITHGEHNLVLGTEGVAKAGGDIDYSNYLLTGSDIASTAAIHAQGAGATVTQQGGTLTVDDAVTVTTTAGTINLEGGALNGTVSGATINATSGALNATLNGENTLHGNNYALQGEIANNGTLTVSGTFDASALHLDTEAATHIDVNGQSGASGFAKDASYSVAIFSGTVVNDGATVTHGTHTLELGADGVAKAGGTVDYSDYLLTGSDTASTSDIHIIGPGATVTQQGGILTVDDTVTVTTTGGTINLEGGALNGTVSGATINAGAGELNAILSGSNTLYGENYLLTGALNNTGTLILEGTFELSTQLPEDVHQATHIDVNGQSGASGFAKAEQHDITIAIGGDIITESAVFTRGGKTLTPGEGGKVISGGEIDYSNYLLTGTDSAATSAIHAIGPDATVTQTGGTLTVDDAVTVTTTAGTINLAGGTLNGMVSGATINAASGTLNAILTGSNTLHGVNYVLQDAISNSGTLTVSGTFDASALQLDTTETTHIDVYGQSGASGFAKAVGYSVAVVNGGSVVNDGAEITHGSISLTLGTDGVATAGGEIDYGTYYLHDGAEVAVSAIRTVPEAAVATVDMDGGLLEADADVEVDSTGGRIEVSQDARVSGSIHDTQVAIRGCEISADITGGSTVTVGGETILSGHNTYTGDTDVMDGGLLKVTGSIISDVHLRGGIMDTAAGMALVDGQDVVFTGGNVRGNLRTVAGSGLNLEQNGLVDGDLTLGGGTLKLGDGCVLSVSGSLTLDAATTLVGDWQADEVYTLIVTGGVQDESGTASLNEFFSVSDELGTVRMEGNTILLDTHTHHTADAMDTTLVDSLWASSSYIREFARLAEGQSYAVRRGETAVWGGGFGSFMNVSGNDGFTSDGAGYAFGVNHAFSTNIQAGVGLGQSFGSYHNKALTGAKVHQKGMMAAATAQYLSAKGGSFMLSGHAAVGRVRNNADTYLGGLAGKSRWDDTMLSLGAHASYAMHVTVDTVIAPFIGMEWMYGSQESFSDSHGRRYSNGKLSELRMPVGVTLRSSTTIGSDTRLLPELSVAFVPSLVQHNPHADTTVQGGTYRTEGYDPGRHGFMLNAGMNVLFSESWSAGAFYTLETRKHAVNQSVNASLQYRF